MTTVLITGAARGIGLELARQYHRRGCQVIATCRKPSKELTSLGLQVIEDVEVSDQQSIDRLAKALQGEALDILINNAGILTREGLTDMNWQRIEEQFAVNTLGPLRVTTSLLSNLHPGSKVIIITSRMGSIADNGSGGMYGYRISKAGVNMAGKSLAIDLQERDIAVALLHPGMVATNMTGKNGIPPAESAAGLIERIDALTLEQSGSWWHADGQALPW